MPNPVKTSFFPWSQLVNRKIRTISNRLRIGYTRLTHGYLTAIEEQSRCLTCEVIFTVNHILADSQRFKRLEYTDT